MQASNGMAKKNTTTNSNNKSMEEALQAAVAHMNNGSSASPAQPSGGGIDPMTMFASLLPMLPKLLEARGSRDDSGDRQEELEPLREQLAAQAELLQRIYRSQRVLLRELRVVQNVQGALSGILANQLQRVEIIQDAPSRDDGGYDDGVLDPNDLGLDPPMPRPRRPLRRKR
jgi:hypothetical protein